jgi:hypothetical protein
MPVISWILLSIGLGLLAWVFLKPVLGEVPPIDIAIKKSKVVWGLWFSGDRIYSNQLLEKYNSVKRILLVDPNTDVFRMVVEKSIETESIVENEIKRLTKQAMSKGIPVRWYRKFQVTALTLYDPENNKAWCVLQELKPNVPREDRPLSKIKGTDSQYKGVLARFQDIWDNYSRVPTSSEIDSAMQDEPTVAKKRDQNDKGTKKDNQA